MHPSWVCVSCFFFHMMFLSSFFPCFSLFFFPYFFPCFFGGFPCFFSLFFWFFLVFFPCFLWACQAGQSAKNKDSSPKLHCFLVFWALVTLKPTHSKKNLVFLAQKTRKTKKNKERKDRARNHPHHHFGA